MFGNKTTETNSSSSSSNSRSSSSNSTTRSGDKNSWNNIARGTVLVGNINAEGDMRIEGKVIGTLVCNSKLVVSSTGYIEGSVDARTVVVEGEIKGNVVTRELLQIDKSGKISGDVFTQKLVVQMGAIFTGSCKMGDDAKAALAKKPQTVSELESRAKNPNNGSRPMENKQLQKKMGKVG